jgi:ABC-type multidrug transport system fused ATPase/permease subunit
MKPTRLFLLDEATSALDALTERKIRDSIDRARAGRTTVVIAHRLASVAHADRIFVLEGGHLRETGTPRQLLANRGVFYDLYEAQKLELHLAQASPQETE